MESLISDMTSYIQAMYKLQHGIDDVDEVTVRFSPGTRDGEFALSLARVSCESRGLKMSVDGNVITLTRAGT